MGRRKKVKKELICEDWCFLCKDGGSLRICDYRDCLKAYHPECVGNDDSMLENEDNWACNWHYCFLCNKASKFYCFCCPYAVCGRCIHNAEFALARRNKGFCNDCLELTLLIEEDKDVDSNGHKIDFNDQDTVEFLFKEYWLLTKKKEGFTSEDLISAYNQLKSGKRCTHDSDSYEYNEGEEEISEFDEGQLIMSDDLNGSEEQKQIGKKKRSRRNLSVVKRDLRAKKKEFIGWGSKPLLEFLTSIGKDTDHELSEYDITTIIIEYCKENKLFHPERKKKIICDSRLQPLFRRKSVNKNSIHNLLSSHLAENMDHLEDELECYSQYLDGDDLVGGKKQQQSSLVKRHHSKKEVVDVKKSCFASVVPTNIKLVYLRRSLVVELSKQLKNFDDKVMGSFVRVKSDPNDYLQKNSYQLVQVTGIKKTSIGNPQILLQVSNMVKEVPITKLSDDDFSEEECEDLHQRVKNGQLKRPTVVELDLKARSLHEDIMNHVSNFIYNHGWVLATMRKFCTKELIRPAPTRFATAYLTLQSMFDMKQGLEQMFTSKEWEGCTLSKKSEGREIKRIVLRDGSFWQSMLYALKTTRPLISVLRMADYEKMPGMGFIYGAMDKAKEEIASNLGGDLGAYNEIWNIIDKKWEYQMHRHLHAAAYFLNPQFQYSQNKSKHPEIKLGLYSCMEKLIPNEEDREKADEQIDLFKYKKGMFGFSIAIKSAYKRPPAEWWIQFGDGTPQLTSFAVRVLSLTCSSSACERNWSAFNMWIGREIVSLQHRVDRANEKGWRRELSEYLDKLLLLQTPAEQSRLLNQTPEVIADAVDEEPAFEDSAKNEQECKDGSSDSPPSRTSKTSSCNLEGNGVSCCQNILRDNPGQEEMITAVPAVMEEATRRNPIIEDFVGQSTLVEVPVMPETHNINHLSCMNCYQMEISPSSNDGNDASEEPPIPSSPQAQAHTPPLDPPQSSPLATASDSTSPPPLLFTPSTSPNPVNSMSLANEEILVTHMSTEQCASTSAPQETCGPPFSNLGDARAFFAEVDHILDESLKDFPESLPTPVAPQDINQAKCVLYQYRFLNFESLLDPDQSDQFNSSLELLLKTDYFPSSVLDLVRRFHKNFVSNLNLYFKSQEILQTVDKNIEDTMAWKGRLANNRTRFDEVLRDIELRSSEIDELNKQLDELTKKLEVKKKLRANLEAEANDLAQSSVTSKNALAHCVHNYKNLEKDRQAAEEAIEDIEAFWEQFRIQTSNFL